MILKVSTQYKKDLKRYQNGLNAEIYDVFDEVGFINLFDIRQTL